MIYIKNTFLAVLDPVLQKLFILLFLFFTFFLYTIEIPKPKNDQLLSEYDSYRYAKYLKKPVVGSGYLAMNGKDRFVFVQSKPVFVKIKKTASSTTYQKGNTMAVDITAMTMDFFFLFEDQKSLENKYNITKNVLGDDDEFRITPKDTGNLKVMVITSKEDKIKKLELIFQDDSKLIYMFKNTVTGKAPDEKYF